MEATEQITVTRTLFLQASADEVWRLLTDPEELSLWFASSASIDVVPGGVGRFVDGDAVRRAVVHHVEPLRRLGFTWWDESQPADASTVELVVSDTSIDGRVQLTITETLVPSGGDIGARACSWIDAADSWDGRIGALADTLAARCSPLVCCSPLVR
jgi:uncharacterized protein YndB with AHSA1/START domain